MGRRQRPLVRLIGTARSRVRPSGPASRDLASCQQSGRALAERVDLNYAWTCLAPARCWASLGSLQRVHIMAALGILLLFVLSCRCCWHWPTWWPTCCTSLPCAHAPIGF